MNLPLEPVEPDGTASSLPQRIDALLEFLPKFEAGGASAGDWTPTQERDGCLTMPAFNLSPELAAFEQALYQYGWVAKFEWPDWQEKAARLVDSPESVRTADLETLQKLLTTHVRKERFCEGHLAAMFECGHITAILHRLKELRKTVVEQSTRPQRAKRRGREKG